jgi:hypothetical protein
MRVRKWRGSYVESECQGETKVRIAGPRSTGGDGERFRSVFSGKLCHRNPVERNRHLYRGYLCQPRGSDNRLCPRLHGDAGLHRGSHGGSGLHGRNVRGQGLHGRDCRNPRLHGRDFQYWRVAFCTASGRSVSALRLAVRSPAVFGEIDFSRPTASPGKTMTRGARARAERPLPSATNPMNRLSSAAHGAGRTRENASSRCIRTGWRRRPSSPRRS